MLGLPPSTDFRRQIPKNDAEKRKGLFTALGIKGKEKERFDDHVHSVTVRAIISEETVNLPAGKDVKAIYLIEVQLNTEGFDESDILLLDRMGHKAVYLLTYGSRARLAVVERMLFMDEWRDLSGISLSLEGLDLDSVWENLVRSVGHIQFDGPLDAAVEEADRVRKIDRQLEILENKMAKEKQNSARRELYARIKELRKMRDSPPETDRWPLVNDLSSRELFPKGGVSVRQRVRTVHQPPGGFIDPKSMSETCFSDGLELGPENVSPQLIGTVVDYLSRFILGDSREEAFCIPIIGAKRLGRSDEMDGYIGRISGLDDESVISACRASSFDSYVRAGAPPKPDPSDILPDGATCENVRIMVGRVKRFLDEHGPVTQSCPNFMGGYTEMVSRGDGDFLTEDAVWDLKVSKYPPTQDQTLQLAMYFLMGKHTPYPWFSTVTKIGIFNPRLNRAYVFDMLSLPKDTVRIIETDVIGYGRGGE